jgi:UDP-N-acetyl-D-glucosamine dehydrogenase
MAAPKPERPVTVALHQRIADRTARVGVVGLGYVGLPLAVEFARAGFSVIGIDVDQQKCDAINRGESTTPDVSAGDVSELTEAGTLTAVSDLAMAPQLDTINICVPTPLRKTRDPDLSYVLQAARAVKAHLRPGMLVILESTTYPGATEEIVKPILEETGLTAGTDFFLAFSPERVDPGNRRWTTRNIPKVVGGLTSECSVLAEALYATCISQVVRVSSPRTAEMTKLLENTFRAVNIGLVNELAILCDRIGIDVWEVIGAASTKPFGFMPFYPGPGLGGHCIPVDPLYLSWKVRQVGFEARFIDLASQINGLMPSHVVEKVTDALNDHGKAVRGAGILVMGVAYKPEVGDVRESPALDVIALLLEKGANVTYHDPFVPSIDAAQQGGELAMTCVAFNRERLLAADCVVVLTHHHAFDALDLASAKLVVDTRNAIKTNGRHIFKLGMPNPGN